MDSSRDIVRKLRESRLLNERNNYEEMDHKDLVKLAQEGDQLALETLMNEYDAAIEKSASKFIFDSGDSEDAKQIARIGFWEAVQNWEGKGSFGAYANMIMNRKLTDQLRKDSAEKELIHSQAASMDAPVASDEEGGEMTLGASIPSKGLSPEEEYLGNDGARKITEFMKNNLSDVERQVILKYIEGYKVSEITEETGMKYKSVENAIKRVKDKLAEYMRNMKESRQIKLSESSIFSDEEKEILKNVLSKIDGDMNESKDVEEHLEVSAGAGSTTAEKVAYVKKMVEKAKNGGDEHSAWDIVDFLYDSMLLDQIPLDESTASEEMNESGVPAGWENDPESENPGWNNDKYEVSAYWQDDENEFLLFPYYSDSPLGNARTWDEVESIASKYSKKPNESSVTYEMDDEDKLDQIESDLEDAEGIIEDTDSEDAYQEAIDTLEKLDNQLWDLLEVEDHDIVQRAKELQRRVWSAQEMPPENIKREDPYISRGLSRDDFY